MILLRHPGRRMWDRCQRTQARVPWGRGHEHLGVRMSQRRFRGPIRHWLKLVPLAGAAGALAMALPAVAGRAAATDPTPCTMTSAANTGFNTGTQKVHIENTVSTDLTATQHLVLRSLTGGPQYFRLTSLTSAACHDNPSYPAEEGGMLNTFTGNGTGAFGTDINHNVSGYSIHFEIGDRGDGSTPESTTADTVNFVIKNSAGTVVWSGRGNLFSGSEEIASSSAIVAGSCAPSSSIGVLVQSTNVVAYVPKGNWGSGSTGIDAVNVEGSSITNTDIATPNAVNSAASDALTGETVAVSNGTDVYTISGTTLTHTLTDSGSGSLSFTGGAPTTASVAMDAAHGRALLGLSTASGPGFQFLNLSSNAFNSAFTTPSGYESEDPLIDPVRNLILSASENGNYELINVTSPTSPQFFENATGGGELDSSGEDCSTGIALAPAEFSNPSSVFIADLTQAHFTPGSPSGTWTAPSQIQTLDESSLAAGASGIAVAQGTHTGVVTGEFGGSAITAIKLPSTSGSGTPAITDWVTCNIGNTPDGNTWSEGDDPHTVTAYQSPNTGNADGLFANEEASWLAKVDLTKMLDPTAVPRDAAGHACTSGTLPSSVESFVSLP
jgi:hypothetical protein